MISNGKLLLKGSTTWCTAANAVHLLAADFKCQVYVLNGDINSQLQTWTHRGLFLIPPDTAAGFMVHGFLKKKDRDIQSLLGSEDQFLSLKEEEKGEKNPKPATQP